MSEKAEKKPEAAPAEGAEKAEAKKKGGLLTKLPVLLGGVMVIEAIVLFAGFKMLGGGAPKAAAGAELATSDSDEEHGDEKGDEHGEKAEGGHEKAEAKSEGHGGEAKGGGGGEGHEAKGGEHDAKPAKPAVKKKFAELKVVEFRALNRLSGKTILYDVSIYAVVKGDREEKVKRVFEDRGALIQDRVRTIIAQNDPEKLGGGVEPGLETLRRQVKRQLDEIVGDSMIEEVLVPKCIPFPGGY